MTSVELKRVDDETRERSWMRYPWVLSPIPLLQGAHHSAIGRWKKKGVECRPRSDTAASRRAKSWSAPRFPTATVTRMTTNKPRINYVRYMFPAA